MTASDLRVRVLAMAGDDVTHWLHRLAEGDEAAAQAIWQEYFHKLLRLARKHLEGLPRRSRDEEDVTLSAMNAFLQGVMAGKYPQLKDRHDLWRLLVKITVNKAITEARRVRAEKRGEGDVRGESAFVNRETSDVARGIEQVMGREPTPRLACVLAENCRTLLDRLGDKSLRTVALCKMEGYTNQEIAEKLGYTVRTVERKLARIRTRWSRVET